MATNVIPAYEGMIRKILVEKNKVKDRITLSQKLDENEGNGCMC